MRRRRTPSTVQWTASASPPPRLWGQFRGWSELACAQIRKLAVAHCSRTQSALDLASIQLAAAANTVTTKAIARG